MRTHAGPGFAGTGVTGMGADHQIFARDLPVPIWEGDGYVTGSHQGDTLAFLAQRQCNGIWMLATTHPQGEWVGKAERGGWAVVSILQNGTFSSPNTFIGANKEYRWYRTTGIACRPQKPPVIGEFSSLLPFHTH